MGCPPTTYRGRWEVHLPDVIYFFRASRDFTHPPSQESLSENTVSYLEIHVHACANVAARRRAIVKCTLLGKFTRSYTNLKMVVHSVNVS